MGQSKALRNPRYGSLDGPSLLRSVLCPGAVVGSLLALILDKFCLPGTLQDT